MLVIFSTIETKSITSILYGVWAKSIKKFERQPQTLVKYLHPRSNYSNPMASFTLPAEQLHIGNDIPGDKIPEGRPRLNLQKRGTSRGGSNSRPPRRFGLKPTAKSQNSGIFGQAKTREEILAAGVQGAELAMTHFPEADRQQLRQIILQHNREVQGSKPPSASRKLFRYLKELQQAYGDPDGAGG